MAAMGRATLKELERVLSSVAQVEQRSRHQSVGIEAVTSSAPPNDPGMFTNLQRLNTANV